MDLSSFSTTTVILFLLMLTRITGMVFTAPFFSQNGVPMQVQVGIALAMSLLLFPVYSINAVLPAQNMWMFTWIAGQEFAIGMLLGFVANMFFASLQMAGSFVTTQMGLGVAHALDPVSNQQSPVMGQFYFILAIFIFMGLNIHHTMIIAVVKSFEAIPLASGLANLPMITARFMSMAAELFSVSVMLVMPLVGMMLVEEIALAFMSKIMPQMNVFMVAMPLKIMSGLVLMYITLPFTAEALVQAYGVLVQHLLGVFAV